MTSTTHGTRSGWFSLSTAGKVNVGAMVLAVVAIVVQIAAGVDYPTVPPGPIILTVAAGLVAFTRWPGARVVAVIVPLFLTVGGTIAFLVGDDIALRHPDDDVVAFLATAVQMVAVVVAFVAGVRALREGRRLSA
jgi:hypothetical protein